MLLIAFLSVLGWGSWTVYDRSYRQPRFEEMRQLYFDYCKAAARLSLYDLKIKDEDAIIPEIKAHLNDPEPKTGIDEKTGAVIVPDLEFVPRRGQKGLKYHQNQREFYYRQYEFVRSQKRELDARSRQRFGVTAAELGKLLPDQDRQRGDEIERRLDLLAE